MEERQTPLHAPPGAQGRTLELQIQPRPRAGTALRPRRTRSALHHSSRRHEQARGLRRHDRTRRIGPGRKREHPPPIDGRPVRGSTGCRRSGAPETTQGGCGQQVRPCVSPRGCQDWTFRGSPPSPRGAGRGGEGRDEGSDPPFRPPAAASGRGERCGTMCASPPPLRGVAP